MVTHNIFRDHLVRNCRIGDDFVGSLDEFRLYKYKLIIIYFEI